jgi:hypothetical protein
MGLFVLYTICPADNATAGSLGRRRAGQLRFGFVAVSARHIVYCLQIRISGFIDPDFEMKAKNKTEDP